MVCGNDRNQYTLTVAKKNNDLSVDGLCLRKIPLTVWVREGGGGETAKGGRQLIRYVSRIVCLFVSFRSLQKEV